IQSQLLPQRHVRACGWEAGFHYEPAGAVSGDYCDIIQTDGESLLFLLGDVAGKGLAASLLMSNLNAIFRTLVTLNLQLGELMERANRLFCEAGTPGFFATVVCGRAHAGGRLEIVNAGHCPPVMVSGNETRVMNATGLPLGLFCNSKYDVTTLQT